MSLTQKKREAYAALKTAFTTGSQTQVVEELNSLHPFSIASELGVTSALIIPFEDYLKEELLFQQINFKLK